MRPSDVMSACHCDPLDETVEINDGDHWDLGGKTWTSTADPMIRINGSNWSMRNGKIQAQGGVLIEQVRGYGGLVQSLWGSQTNPNKELYVCEGTNSCYDTLVQACTFSVAPNMTVPMVRVQVNGPYYNANTWQRIRFQTNGGPTAPVILLESTKLDNWIYSNVIKEINFELPYAGAIHAFSTRGLSVEDVTVFDTPLECTDHLVQIGKTTGGLNSKDTYIKRYTRLQGSLATGKYDVYAMEHYSDSLIVDGVSGISGVKAKLVSSTMHRSVQGLS